MPLNSPPRVRSRSDPEYQAWLDEILTLPEGAAIRRVSVDTIRREGKFGRLKLINLSPRRLGITRREAMKGLYDP